MKMEAKQDPKTHIITLTITPSADPKPSASGKSLTLYTTGGFDKQSLEGVGINLTLSRFV